MNNEELEKVLTAIRKVREDYHNIELLSKEEVELIREVIKDRRTAKREFALTEDEVTEFRAILAERKFKKKFWGIMKTIGITAGATLVAYQVVFDSIKQLFSFLLRGFGIK